MVKVRERFKRELKAVFDFIAEDSKTRARTFKDELMTKAERVSQTPFICRKSINFDNENIRDLIFKGYVIPYLIIDGGILLLGIYGANKWQA